jgi:hypothetical protein
MWVALQPYLAVVFFVLLLHCPERKLPVKRFDSSTSAAAPGRSTQLSRWLFRWLPVIVSALGTALALTLSPPAGAAAPQAPQGPASVVRVAPVNIIDRAGFGQPMVAASLFIPAGWPSQTDVLWNMNLGCGALQWLRLRAVSPDGSARFELMPGEAWSASNYGGKVDGCQTASFRGARDYLQAWVQRYRPGARVLDYRARPDRSVAPEQRQVVSTTVRIWTDSGQVLIGYAFNGREMRETVLTDVQFTSIQSAMPGGNGGMESLQGRSLSLMSWRAPEGKLELRHVDAVIDSVRVAANWKAQTDALQMQLTGKNLQTGAQVMAINAETARQTLNAIAQRGQAAVKARAELNEINAATYRATQDSLDRQHVETIKSIRGVENYRQPNGGRVVELSNLYNHAWQLKDGSYVLTDNPNFNPNQELGIGGQEMARAR